MAARAFRESRRSPSSHQNKVWVSSSSRTLAAPRVELGRRQRLEERGSDFRAAAHRAEPPARHRGVHGNQTHDWRPTARDHHLPAGGCPIDEAREVGFGGVNRVRLHSRILANSS